MKAQYIAGDKICLRPLEESDIPCMVAWVNDRNITQYLTIEPKISEEQELAWLTKMSESETDLVFGIINKKSSIHIGNIGFHCINKKTKSADVGIFIGNIDQQGKGYGTEALQLAVEYICNKLNIKTIHATVFANNVRSIALFGKVGFQKKRRGEQSIF